MPTYLGIDGFRLGWVGVWLNDNGDQHFDHSNDLAKLLASTPFSLAMIDMPIGLPDRGHRLCDRNARALLGPAVFPGVRRDFWRFESQNLANQYYWENDEPGISAQLWAIRKKVREVDELMTPERQREVRETHPELVFYHLNGSTKLQNKKTESGRNQRIDILHQQGFNKLSGWLKRRSGTGIGRDDLIDACACALAASKSSGRIPLGEPPVDSKGLRMEMWF